MTYSLPAASKTCIAAALPEFPSSLPYTDARYQQISSQGWYRAVELHVGARGCACKKTPGLNADCIPHLLKSGVFSPGQHLLSYAKRFRDSCHSWVLITSCFSGGTGQLYLGFKSTCIVLLWRLHFLLSVALPLWGGPPLLCYLLVFLFRHCFVERRYLVRGCNLHDLGCLT